MNKAYERIDFVNGTAPALNESNLNAMSTAIDEIDNRVCEMADGVGEYLPKAENIVKYYETIKEDVLNTTTNAERAKEDREAADISAQKAKISEDNAKAIVGIGIATAEQAGIVKPDGVGTYVTEDGKMKLNPATATTLGAVSVGAGLKISKKGLLEIDSTKYSYEKKEKGKGLYYYDIQNKMKSAMRDSYDFTDTPISRYMFTASQTLGVTNISMRDNDEVYKSAIDIAIENDKTLWGLLGNIELMDAGVIDGVTTTASKQYVFPYDDVWVGIFHSYLKTNGTARSTFISMFIGCHDGMTTTANGVLKQANLTSIGTAGHTATNSFRLNADKTYNSVLGLAAAATNIKVQYKLFKVMGARDDF